jgi:hypothetical protein
VHGYHPWAEDAEIYVPSVEKLLNPHLFPFNAQFFETHAHFTYFPDLVAAVVRASHLPLPYSLFFFHLISIFLLLFACWKLAGRCFTRRASRYAGVALVAALLTLPIAGTALYIMDQYVNPRNLTAFLGILAIAKSLDRKYFRAGFLLLFGAAIHPLMFMFVVAFCFLLFWMQEVGPRWGIAACLLPLGFLGAPSAAYHQAAISHSYFYLMRWQWYEWLGLIGPVLILEWFNRIGCSRGMNKLALISRTLVIYETIFVIVALVVSVPTRFESLARLQPMRSLYLLYILLALFSGGLLSEYVLKDRWGRWIALFLPLCVGMFCAQRALFPASAHIEWPGSAPSNPWVQAFEWARENTPSNAVFALDPSYMHIPGEDENGFRAIAQRSMLADGLTDGGAVSMFPSMADEWLSQEKAQSGWQNFVLPDFRRLQAKYGLTWVVLQRSSAADLQCLYENQAVKVCKVDDGVENASRGDFPARRTSDLGRGYSP